MMKWTVWASVTVCLPALRSHVQVLIQSDKRSEVMTTAHPLTHKSPHFLPLFKSAVAPSAFSLLPLHSPMTWHSYNPLRHVLMFEVYLFIYCLLLSVATHPHTSFLSFSLNSPLFLRSPEKRRGKQGEEMLLYGLAVSVAAIMSICCLFICCLCLPVHLRI